MTSTTNSTPYDRLTNKTTPATMLPTPPRFNTLPMSSAQRSPQALAERPPLAFVRYHQLRAQHQRVALRERGERSESFLGRGRQNARDVFLGEHHLRLGGPDVAGGSVHFAEPVDDLRERRVAGPERLVVPEVPHLHRAGAAHAQTVPVPRVVERGRRQALQNQTHRSRVADAAGTENARASQPGKGRCPLVRRGLAHVPRQTLDARRLDLSLDHQRVPIGIQKTKNVAFQSQSGKFLRAYEARVGFGFLFGRGKRFAATREVVQRDDIRASQ
mmetsp:Transcript_3564/g.15085  ORF Transcript_3564/g.15085 Transcript_3564/m.15085 type:complete len:273 (+) Transcript_3564:819-1637(+)